MFGKSVNVILVTGVSLLIVAAASGQDAFSAKKVVNSDIPDNNASGLASAITIDGLGGEISSVTVILDITGGFNGDLYAYLAGPGGGFAVLLNWVGMDSSSADGCGNAGFDVTPGDAAGYNIHTYQLEDNPDGGAVTGIWQPDGENIAPQSAPSAFPTLPTATLSSFNGMSMSVKTAGRED